jgi:GNAT superfamily N-acetyltransferase
MKSPIVIRRLGEDYKALLESIYTQSEFIDPLDDIIQRINDKNNAPVSHPFSAMLADEALCFFCIDSSNPHIGFKRGDKGAFWLESFFIPPPFLGKGYGSAVVREVIGTLPGFFPKATSLNLTVNFRNLAAQRVYKTSGFRDTGLVYHKGPAGPQHIYEKAVIPVR